VLGPIEAYYTRFTIDKKLAEITSAITSGVTEEQLNEAIASAKTEIEGEIPSLSGYATEQWVTDQHYITGVDLSDYATTEQMNNAITAATDGLATEEYVNAQISSQTSDFVTGEQLSSYTYDKSTIDEKIAEGGIFDPTQYYTTAQTVNLVESAVTRVEGKIPTSASQLTNDSGYITSQSLSGYVTMEEFGDYIMRLRAEIESLRQAVSGCCEIPPTPTPTGDTDCVVRIKYTQGEDFVIPCEESYIGNLESFELPSPYTRPDATAVTVGNCTGQIGQGCFEDFFQLQTVHISSTVSSIRLEAFYGCSALTTVTIEATTPPIMVWNNTFEGCTSLQHIYVPAQSVNAYKTAQYWDTYANLIEPIP
jgi:hypothetical protein